MEVHLRKVGGGPYSLEDIFKYTFKIIDRFFPIIGGNKNPY